MTGVSVEVVGRAAVQQRQEATAGAPSAGKDALTISTNAMEISGMAAVETSTMNGPSLKFVGKAAVETPNGSSLEIIGEASLQSVSAAGSLQIIEKASGAQEGHAGAGRGRTWSLLKPSGGTLGIVGAGLACWCAVWLVRFLYLWEQCLLKSGATAWPIFRASAVLGTEVSLFFMLVLVVLMVPRMIVTWTTAVVFEYVLGVVVSGKVKRNQVVRNGSRKAKEISWMTLTSVVEEGNIVAAAVLLMCFATTAALRSLVKVD